MPPLDNAAFPISEAHSLLDSTSAFVVKGGGNGNGG
jgi:hypothetical protein